VQRHRTGRRYNREVVTADGAWIGAAAGAGVGVIVGVIVGVKKSVEKQRRYRAAVAWCVGEWVTLALEMTPPDPPRTE
jgi:hypothetical protein